MRGGEKVLEQLCHLFSDAEIHCLVYAKEHLAEAIKSRRIHGSFLQKSAFARKNYKQLLPLHPIAIGAMKVPEDTSIVICSDASMIKGIRVPASCKVICYCHSPPRYLWEMADEYAEQSSEMGFFKRLVFKTVIPYCKRFDFRSAQRVDRFIANSHFVASRIKKYYGKDSTVIYPPVSVGDFDHKRLRQNFYLAVSELVPYKRIELLVEAFNRSGLELRVIGDGSELEKLRAAAGSNITFLGSQPFDVVKDHFETCRAFLFPGLEDFGITPVEAQAAGAPVVAFGKGGALETVIDGKTGVHFSEQTADAINAALSKLDSLYSCGNLAMKCRENALKFESEEFRKEFRNECSSVLNINV